ncbi:ADENYLATE ISOPENTENYLTRANSFERASE 5 CHLOROPLASTIC [Salix purpurea]|uniref:adenylate dimethylallyltransferase (ADP/ATP-dependent) n=1 Tax=Salix purpurea TaxID=77065 RepID=A0A9Q0Z8Q9_SALPP|nr:ADENYLATE ISOPENTENYLTRANSFERASE 5 CHLOROPLASTIC [Salix purpurea]
MTMGLSLSAYKQVQTRVNFQGELSMKPFFRRKDKVVFVLGPTGTGKSRLAIDLATHFPAEVVNCDKMQVYKGLDIVTNKVTEEECRGVPHHLLGIADPNADFTSEDFRHHASLVVESIVTRDRLPIIAGGSNSYVEALANDDSEFRLRYDCFFLWVDVSLSPLHSFVSDRVDRMVRAGLIDEVRKVFDPTKFDDYSQGIKRAIGVPELDQFLRNEMIVDAKTSRELRDKAIEKIKENTCMLAHRQKKKIEQLQSIWNWEMHRIDATPVFLASGKEADNLWDRMVAGPSTLVVDRFLRDENHVSAVVPSEPANMVPISVPAMAVVSTG